MKKISSLFRALTICLATVVVLGACNNTGVSQDDSVDSDTVIYNAGGYGDESDIWHPCYWKGTEVIALDLPPGGYTSGSVSGIRVVGETVYVSGDVRYDVGSAEESSRDIADTVNSACYWTGATVTQLPVPDGTTYSSATSIFVSDDDIYVSGYYKNGSNDVPCYWKNSSRVDLPIPTITMGTSTGVASAVFVYAGKLYISGYNDTDDPTIFPGTSSTKPCYWVDGDIHFLASLETAEVTYTHSISVSNNVIYVGGESSYSHAMPDSGTHYTYQPSYWIDGVRTDLALPTVDDEGWGYVSVVEDGTVYTSGSYGTDGQPCYWTGTTRTDIPVPAGEDGASAYGIFVSNGTVYLAGSHYPDAETTKACYWTGTVKTDLPIPAGYTRSSAGLIIIQ